VLLLGVVIPTQPDIDDDDDNVGCAAVMPSASRKSIRAMADAQPRKLAAVPRTATQASDRRIAATGSKTLSILISAPQVSPPLRA